MVWSFDNIVLISLRLEDFLSVKSVEKWESLPKEDSDHIWGCCAHSISAIIIISNI